MRQTKHNSPGHGARTSRATAGRGGRLGTALLSLGLPLATALLVGYSYVAGGGWSSAAAVHRIPELAETGEAAVWIATFNGL